MSNANTQAVYNKMNNLKNAITNKGGTVPVNGTTGNPSLDNLITGVQSITTTTIQGGSYIIRTAGVAGTTFVLKDSGNNTLDTQTTSVGGVVDLTGITGSGTYTVEATVSGRSALDWTKTVEVANIGITVCKSGVTMTNYDWATDIVPACKGHYVGAIFDYGDYYDFSSFMGSTSTYSAYDMFTGNSITVPYRRALFVGADIDEKSDGTGYAGGTFIFPRTPSTYRMYSSNNRQVSWVGSEMRSLRCLPNGTDYYLWDSTVTSSTTDEDHYIYSTVAEDFVSVSLPNEYVSGQYYYTKQTTSADGTFVSGLPTELLMSDIVAVNKYTWNGNSATNQSFDILTSDKLWLPCVREICILRGNFYYRTENFKTYDVLADNGFTDNYWRSRNQWFREPSLYDTNYFCSWYISNYNIGSNSASGTVGACLGFCI